MVLELKKERGMFLSGQRVAGEHGGVSQSDRGLTTGAGRRKDSAEVGRE